MYTYIYWLKIERKPPFYVKVFFCSEYEYYSISAAIHSITATATFLYTYQTAQLCYESWNEQQ